MYNILVLVGIVLVAVVTASSAVFLTKKMFGL